MEAMERGRTADIRRVRVLHVDDEPDFADLTATFLERDDQRFSVVTVTDAEEGLAVLEAEHIDCIVSDYDMPGTNGIDFLREVRERDGDLPFILFTGKGSEEVASEAIAAGVSGYLQKAGGTDSYSLLANQIDQLVARHRAERDLTHRARQQEVVATLGQQALVGTSREQLFEFAIDAIASTLQVKHVAILSYEPEEDHLCLRAGRGWEEEELGEATVDARPETQAGYTLAAGEPVLVTNYAEEDRFEASSLLRAHDIESGIDVLIGSADDPWGTLGVHATHPGSFGEEDVNFLQSIANVLGDALARAAREREIRENRQQLRAVLDTVGAPIWIRDAESRFVLVNEDYREFLGVDADTEIVGKLPHDVAPPELADRFLEVDGRVLERGKAIEYERDGETIVPGRTFLIRVAPLRDDSGTIVGTCGIATDITDQRERAEALDAQRRRFEAVYEKSFDAMVLCDDAGRVIDANAEAAELHGHELDELVGREIATFTPDDFAFDRLWEAFLEAEHAQGKLPYVRADGQQRVIEFAARAHVVPGEHLAILRDITEREQRTEELRRYREAIEAAGHAIYFTDVEGVIEYVNPAFEELTGYAPEDAIGETPWIIHSGVHEEAFYEDLRETILAGETWRAEIVNERKDGERYVVDQTIAPITDHDGEITHFVAINIDITEKYQYERELEETRRQLEAILEHTSTPMFLKAADGEYLFVNAAYSDTFDRSRDEVVGARDVDIHADAGERYRETDRAVLESGEPIEYEETTTVDGEERVHLVTKAPVWLDSDDEPDAIFGVGTDITDRKIERELLEQFASVVSHDLRNPLTVASGRLTLAREECDTEELDHIEHALDRMEELIDDVLAVAKEGRAVRETEPVALADIASSVWRTIDTADADLAINADRTIHADESRLKQVLENLFRNAVEYGGEDVAICVGDTAEGFFVEDNGPGIPEDDRETVFDMGVSTGEGTGIGLAVVRQIARGHEWTVQILESPEGGARFLFRGVEFA